ncbi:MAG: LytTR family DNA-binding domain-containing protein, partial [Bacteroidota bacterium]
DDEQSSQKVLEHFIAETEILQLLAICSNAKEAFKYLQMHNDVDLLFLDINMPQQSGLDFYKSLQHPPKVIFTTAYPQYAVDGFEVNAVDYLLKPIAYDRFLTAINKVITQNDANDTSEGYIILKENKALHKVKLQDILFAEAYGDYVKVYTNQQHIVTHSTFTKFLSTLPQQFLRIHKSYSINLDHLKLVSGNQVQIEGHTIPIGPTYKALVIKALNQ